MTPPLALCALLTSPLPHVLQSGAPNFVQTYPGFNAYVTIPDDVFPVAKQYPVLKVFYP